MYIAGYKHLYGQIWSKIYINMYTLWPSLEQNVCQCENVHFYVKTWSKMYINFHGQASSKMCIDIYTDNVLIWSKMHSIENRSLMVYKLSATLVFQKVLQRCAYSVI